MTYEEIRIIKKSSFKKLVRKKTEALAFKELTSKQKPDSKGSLIKYEETIQIADYLLPNKILELEDQREIFRIRSKTNRLPSNWGETILCETACGQNLNNEHILNCPILNGHESENLELNMIYNGNVEEKMKVLNAFRNNMTIRQKYLTQDS